MLNTNLSYIPREFITNQFTIDKDYVDKKLFRNEIDSIKNSLESEMSLEN